MKQPELQTERLLLRPWRDADLAPYAAMNADTRVRAFFPTLLTREESDAEVQRCRLGLERDGFGLLAAELRLNRSLAGMLGLQRMDFAIPGVAQPAVEIGWRLSSAHWGQGLATEGAVALLRFAFEVARLPQVVAITVPANQRSRRVMEKAGMVHRPELDFDHPGVAEGHPLRRHTVYSAGPS